MEQKIVEAINTHFAAYKVETNVDEKNKVTTISAEKDWKSGFDIDIDHQSERVTVSFSSKIRLVAYLVILAVTGLLTFLFGPSMLLAMGIATIVGDSVVTLRIAYIIPVVVFLIPCYPITMFIARKVNPTDIDLLEQVKARLAEVGIEAAVE